MAFKSYSPLRYPGGKAKLYNEIVELIEKNNFNNYSYIEPFAGGAGLALKLLMKNKVKKIIINDIDISIYSFWYSILNHTDEFIKQIEETDINMKNWYHYKDIQNNKNNEDIFNLGFSTFFLNRTNRSGIINAGVIGGKNQNSEYKMDCRFKKNELIKRIIRISEFKSKIKMYNKDTSDFIKQNIKKMKKDYFIFFDPPYFNKGKQLYHNYYNEKDHKNLSLKIKTIKNIPWIVTYDNVQSIKNMYSEYNQIEYSLNYSTGKKHNGKEIMIFNKNVNPIKI